jgi:hypothetical protein
MSIVTDTWRQLVRRRLWPVALLLVGGLAAVPLLLAKDPEPAPVAAAPAAGAGSKQLLVAEPIVTVATDEAGGKRRRVLGVRHDIFKPTAKPPKAEKQAQPVEPKQTGGGSADGGSGDGGSGGGTTPTPEPTTAPAPVAPEKTWPADSVTVAFGDATKELAVGTLKPLRAVGAGGQAILVYEGLKRDGKTAVFLLVGDLRATGDGTCKGVDGTCERLELKVGKTEFLDVLDAEGQIVKQYQLDVRAVHNPSGKGVAKDAVATAARSEDGDGALTAHVAVTGARGVR